jgi:hypothetical protein
MRTRNLIGLFLILVGGLFPARSLAADDCYCSLRLPQGKRVLYIQLNPTELRIAATPEGLAQAKPLPPTEEHSNSGAQNTRFFMYGDIELPLALPRGLTARADFSLTQTSRKGWGGILDDLTYSSIRLRLIKKGTAGDEWVFTTGSAVRPDIGRPTIDLPDLSQLKLDLTLYPDKDKLGIVLNLAGGGVAINSLQKDSQPVAALVTVFDEKGAVIATNQGPVSKFGFG